MRAVHESSDERSTPKRAEPVTTCVDCPAYGTEACEVLEGLGSYCDVMLAASESVARHRPHPRSGTRRAGAEQVN